MSYVLVALLFLVLGFIGTLYLVWFGMFSDKMDYGEFLYELSESVREKLQ